MTLIFLSGILYMSVPISVHLLIKCIIGAVLLGGIIFCSIDRKIQAVMWDKKIVISWMVIGAFQFLCGIVTSMEYLPLACIWLFEFPVLFLVWNNRKDYETFFISVMKGLNICVMLYMVASILIIPITESQYCGFMLNPNGLGQFLTLTFPFTVMMIVKGRTEWEKKIAKIETTATYAFLFFARGRTALLAVGGMTIFLLAAYTFYNRKNSLKIIKR